MSEERNENRVERRRLSRMAGVAARVAKNPMEHIEERHEGVADVVQAIVRAVRSLRQDAVPRMAAALTYRTIFSLVPVLVVGFVVVRGFSGGNDYVKELLRRALDLAGISQIQLDGAEEGPGVEGADGAADGVGAGAGEVTGAVEVEETAEIVAIVETVVGRIGGLNFGAIGLAGALLLVYAALALLVEIERSFNQLYRVHRGRSWMRRAQQYALVILVGPMLLGASFRVGDELTRGIAMVGGGQDTWAGAVAGQVVTVAISWLMLLLLYLSVPNTTVKLRPALIGSFVGAVLWELGKGLFRRYLERAGLETLYGSLALLPLFLLWLYVMWGIVLFGLKVSYTLQFFHVFRSRAGDGEGERDVLLDPSVLLAMMAAVARGFHDATPVSREGLVVATGLTPGVVDRLVEACVGAGMLAPARVRTELGEGKGKPSPDEGSGSDRARGSVGREVEMEVDGAPGDVGAATASMRSAYLLGRPAERIFVKDVLTLGHRVSRSWQTEALGSAVSPGTRAMLDRLRRAEMSAVGNETLADLIGEKLTMNGTGRGAVASAKADGVADEDAGRALTPTPATPSTPPTLSARSQVPAAAAGEAANGEGERGANGSSDVSA